MGIFGKNDGGIMDVIRCDEQDYLIWKWHPQGTTEQTSQRANAIRWGSSLRVRDGSAAVLVYPQPDGSSQEYIEGPFDKVIETDNFPVLASLVGVLYQGNSPFQAEIYFINKAGTIQVPFGVGPVNAFDGRYRDISIPTQVRGAINFRISDVGQFIKCHSLSGFNTEAFKEKIRAFLVGRVKSVVTNAAKDNGISLLQIEGKIPEIEGFVEKDLREKLFNEYGVELVSVNISDIEISKGSPEYKKLEKLTQGKGTLFAQGVVSAIGEIKSTIGGEKKLSDAERGDEPSAAQKVSNALGGLFGKKDKVAPPPIPTAGYYLAVDGKKKGPYDLSRFKKMMQDGEFNSESLIWKEGWENWVKAADVEELSSFFQSTIPPIPDSDK
jgi:membrane protease subunit (stomatin/prohibitin family)